MLPAPRAMPGPTSRTLRPPNAHAHTHERLDGRRRVVLQILVPCDPPGLEHGHDGAAAKGEPAELLYMSAS